MALIHFYEKPGCGNNTKQKDLLIEADHWLIEHDLLTHDWRSEPEKLRSFFGDKPVVEWFNRAAPAIKNGELNPAEIDAERAIELMIEQSLLIRRPLMEIEGRRMAGFDNDEVANFLSLETEDDLESCPKQHSTRVCRNERG
jgi:nitrogenase-associated protein